MRPRLGIRYVRRQLLALVTAGPLLVIPISLLELSRDDIVRTQVWPNGTAYRVVSATVIEAKDRKGAERLFEDHFGVRPELLDDGMRLAALRRVRPGGGEVGPLVQRSTRWFLDMWTTYAFKEELGSSQHVLAVGEQGLQFTYEVDLPGRIDEASVHPATPFISGGTVRWVLTAADLHSESGGSQPLAIRATSRQFKCGNATVILYVALWAAGWLAITVGRRLRARPKRI